VDLITREGLGDLISDGYDLAIRFGEPRPSTLVARRLLDTRVLTVASPGYLKKHGHLPIHSSWSQIDI
jgi:DNA-binding transcriptional LysR family regulator